MPPFASLDFTVIGMLHAPPLPGSPRFGGSRQDVLSWVLRDAETLAAGGVHGLLLENFGDAPFYPGRVPRQVVAEMTALATEVRRRFALPLGVNILRNDGCSALEVAAATGADFIRVNVLCGARLTDQGVVHGIAHRLLRRRRESQAQSVQIYADVNVKHSAPLAVRPLEEEVHDLIQRGGADGLIVSGVATGREPEESEIEAVRQAAANAFLLAGSGVTPQNLTRLRPLVNGVIVGSALKEGNRPQNPIDPHRVRELLSCL